MNRRIFLPFSREILLIFVLLSGFFKLQADSPRINLIEEMTNASCPLCATANPKFFAYIETITDNTIPLVYHAWWPGSSDPMYTDNTTMATVRIRDYYNITSVPNGMLNGVTNFGPADTATLRSYINDASNKTSQIDIRINTTKSGSSVTVTVYVSSSSTLSNKKLRITVAERHHYYTNAGSNGEKDFYYIAKEMLPDETGTTLSISAGGTQKVTETFTIDSDWEQTDLHVVAFVQDNSTKEVLQASRALMDSPTLSSPANNTIKQDLSAKLVWNSLSGISTYHLLVSDDSTLANPIIDEDVSSTSKQLSGLNYGTKYYWAVSAAKTYGTNWSEIRNFTTVYGIVASSGIPNSICPGSDISIPFTIKMSFNSDNIFTAQLSNSQGYFDNPRIIGTIDGTTAGTIQAYIPNNINPGAGYRIRVVGSSPKQGGDDNGKDITINEKPNANISGVNPACARSSEIYSTTTAGGVTNQWFVTGGSISGSTTSNSVKVDWGDNSGLMSVKLVQTSSSTGCTDTATFNVKVNPLPLPKINGKQSVCSRVEENYTASIASDNTYQWIVTGGNFVGQSDQSTCKVLWGNTGDGQIKLVQTVTSTGCKDSTIISVSIKQSPSPSIKGTNIVCHGATETYSTVGIAGHKYAWTVKGGTILGSAEDNLVIVQWGDAGNAEISVEESDLTTGCAIAFKDDITINPSPAASIVGSNSVCNSAVETYSTEAITGQTNKWSAIGGTIQGPANKEFVNIIWNNPGKGSIKLVQKNNETGCIDSTLKEININQTPKSEITGSLKACFKYFETYSTGEDVNLKNQWYVSGGQIQGSSTGNTVQVKFNDIQSGSVSLVRTLISSGCKDSVSLNVTITQFPTPIITGSNIVCANSVETYATTSDPSILNEWFIDGGKVIDKTEDHIVIIQWENKSLGTIKLVQHSLDKTYKDSLTETISINPAPEKPTITYGNASLLSSADNGNQWFLDGNKIQGATDKGYFPDKTGNYTVQVTGSNGCNSEFSDAYFINVSSVDEQNIGISLLIYPNPASGIVNINLAINEILPLTIKITDILGMNVHYENIGESDGNYNKKLDIGKLANGLYIISFQIGNQLYQEKLFINN